MAKEYTYNAYAIVEWHKQYQDDDNNAGLMAVIAHALDTAYEDGRRDVSKPQPPFDAEKVKALIDEVVSTTFDLGVTTYAKLTPTESAKHYVVLHRRQAALHNLYHHLGIDNG